MNSSASEPLGELQFQDFIAPLEPSTFLDDFYEKQYVVLRRDINAGEIFSFGAATQYLDLAARVDSSWMQLVQAGRPVRRVRVQDMQPGEIYNAFGKGSTILLEAIERLWPAAAKLAETLRHALSAKIQVNVYMTPPGFQGAHLHPDIVDVFALQTEGSKHWSIYDGRVHEPLEGLKYQRQLHRSIDKQQLENDETSLPIAEQTTLTPGDLLYLPRGVLHKAVASQDEPSVHLAICVTPLTWVDLFKAAVEVASADNPEWCRNIRPGFESDPHVTDSLYEKFSSMAPGVASSEVFTEALSLVARSSLASRGFGSGEQFANVVAVDAIGLDTWLARRRLARSRIEIRGGSAAIYFDGGHMNGPLSILPVLEFVHAEVDRFQVRDLPGKLSDSSRLVVAKRLIREGLLTIEEV